MSMNFTKKHMTCAGVLSCLGLMSSAAFAVGPTVDQFTPSEGQRTATFAETSSSPAAGGSSTPAVAFGSPIGFGLNFGQLAAGIGGQTLPNTAPNDFDGSMGLAAGLGNSITSIGLEVTANIISLRDNFAEDGSFNAKLHRMLNPTTSIAVGAESFGGWGAARNARVSSFAAITTVINGENGLPIVLNLGGGTNRFRSGYETNGVGVFASVAIVPTDRISFIADFTGVDTNIAVSMVPVRQFPVTLTLGVVNLAEREALTREFAGGLGYLYRF